MFSTASEISRAVRRSVPFTNIPAVSPATPAFPFGSPRTPARNPACTATTGTARFSRTITRIPFPRTSFLTAPPRRKNPPLPRGQYGRDGQVPGREVLLRDRLDVVGGHRPDPAKVRLLERRVVQRGLVEAHVAGHRPLRLGGGEEVGLRGGLGARELRPSRRRGGGEGGRLGENLPQ